MLFKEMIPQIQNAELMIVKAGGTYSYLWESKGLTFLSSM
jgi:hypothetical protein